VELVPVAESELDAFVAMFAAYAEETEPYDPLGMARLDAAETRAWFAAEADAPGAELLWIVASGERGGLLRLQRFEAEPGLESTLEIADCYVELRLRGAGIARAAVEAVLARERARGTAVVDAAVLRDNPALGFWRALGFELRSYRTARRP
jgi:ribosomal protein S18 acetylase RimI-like enzyme